MAAASFNGATSTFGAGAGAGAVAGDALDGVVATPGGFGFAALSAGGAWVEGAAGEA